MNPEHTSYARGLEQGDRDNTPVRVALLEAISEAQIARADAHRDRDYRTARHWKQKADRWQRNFDETTASRTRHARAANGDREHDEIERDATRAAEEGVRATKRPTRRTAQRRTGTR